MTGPPMSDAVKVIAMAICRASCGTCPRDSSVCWDWEAQLPEARYALATLEAEGMAIVPLEPTDAMLRAGDGALCRALECTCQEGSIYRAMIRARPR